MARPNPKDSRSYSDDEINENINAIRRELFDLRFQQATRQLNQSHRFKEARIKLAQLLSIQQERSRSNTSS